MNLQISKTLGDVEKLTMFYNNNSLNQVKFFRDDDKNLLMCSFNVHEFVNINERISVSTNMKNVADLLGILDIDILILQESPIQKKMK